MIIAVNKKLRIASLHDFKISETRDLLDYSLIVSEFEGWLIDDISFVELDANQDSSVIFDATSAELDDTGKIVFTKVDTVEELKTSLINSLTENQKQSLRSVANNNPEILRFMVVFELLPPEIEDIVDLI